MKTYELIGAALDWTVDHIKFPKKTYAEWMAKNYRRYSTDWAHGGPILERERLIVEPWGLGWVASVARSKLYHGPTPLIAAMRCHCCLKLGDEVDIPNELLDNIT